MKFRKALIVHRDKQVLKLMSWKMHCILAVALMLMSCQSLQKNPRIEYVPITRDLEFPEVPTVKAATVSELTQEEYDALTEYIIKAEEIFDTISMREEVLDIHNSTTEN